MSFLDELFADIEKRKETKSVPIATSTTKSTSTATSSAVIGTKRKEPAKPVVVTTEEESWDQALEKYEKKRKVEKQKELKEKKRKAEIMNMDTNNEVLTEMCKMFGRPPPLKKGPINLGDKPFIDTVPKCKVAVEELSRFEVIAVDCEWAGPRDVPRSQELCLVQIADPKDRAYIFDICVGGKDLFDKGDLRKLLENPKIVKIFHDCRWDSDILWHAMGVRLQNVFDTQVGYACYRRQQESFTPLPVGLKSLLKRFALGGTHTTKEEAREDMDKKQDYWKIRPLTELMLQYAREDVLLLPLVYRQITAIFSSSSRAVAKKNSEAYASQKRDKTVEELQTEITNKEVSQSEGVKFIPSYGIPEWDKAAKISLQRMQRRNY
jgi:hypothetical protein